MRIARLPLAVALCAPLVAAAPAAFAAPVGAPADAPSSTHARAHGVRFATFNASLNRAKAGQLERDLSTPDNAQARNVAETIQRTRPDVLLVNEFDHDAGGKSAALFRTNYLNQGQRGAAPIDYPYVYTAPVNTGVPSGFDLDHDGKVAGGNDAWGFGDFPGQYGMVVYSRYPIDTKHVRTFRNFRWKDMPGALLPDDPKTPAKNDWYSAQQLARFPLSSKSHWDVPIRVGFDTIHLLASHPTPPTFDGAEDRNGRRNHDEIRFWADYVAGGRRAGYVYDDRGRRGGLRHGANFVIEGDMNADPNDGDSVDGAANQLLDSPRVNTSFTPASDGAVEQARLQGKDNARHRSNPAYDTNDFSEPPGNLRTDYVLPSTTLRIRGGGVFWPTSTDPLFRLVGTYPPPTSDHRLVWLDVTGRRR